MTRREFLKSFSLVGLWFIVKDKVPERKTNCFGCLPMCLEHNPSFYKQNRYLSIIKC